MSFKKLNDGGFNKDEETLARTMDTWLTFEPSVHQQKLITKFCLGKNKDRYQGVEIESCLSVT